MYQRKSDAYRGRRIQYRQSRIQCRSGRLQIFPKEKTGFSPICTAKNAQKRRSHGGDADEHGCVGVRRRRRQEKLDDAAIWAI